MISLLKDWQTQPFVDIHVTSENVCPEEFPEDAIYEIWSGIRGMCDCLQREGDRIYVLNGDCTKTIYDKF